MKKKIVQKRINMGGNYCGHDPLNPVLELVNPAQKGKGGIPLVLTKCMGRLDDYYYRPKKLIPSLEQANGSTNKQRSERRESCILLLKSLIKHTDLTSLRVGIPTADGFMNYTLRYIAMDTGMDLKRVERTMADCKSAGIVTVSQARKQRNDGSWVGLAAVKTVSRHLFGLLGLAEMLKRERVKASKRLKQKLQQLNQEPDTQTSRARNSLSFKSVFAKVKKPNHSGTKISSPPRNKELDKQLMILAAKIKEKHMDWDRDRCYKEAQKLL